MPDEKGDPVRGDVGHWRYRKDKALGNIFDKKGQLIQRGPPEEGTTTEKSFNKNKGKGKKESGTPDPKGVYTKEVAKGFNRLEQMNLLQARGVEAKGNENTLVKKILESNPEPADPKDADSDTPPADDFEPEAPIPPKTKDYTEEEFKEFKPKKQADILKELGVEKPSMIEKGRVKQFLELQG